MFKVLHSLKYQLARREGEDKNKRINIQGIMRDTSSTASETSLSSIFDGAITELEARMPSLHDECWNCGGTPVDIVQVIDDEDRAVYPMSLRSYVQYLGI